LIKRWNEGEAFNDHLLDVVKERGKEGEGGN
jgi:hypothetical protein